MKDQIMVVQISGGGMTVTCNTDAVDFYRHSSGTATITWESAIEIAGLIISNAMALGYAKMSVEDSSAVLGLTKEGRDVSW